MATFQKIVLVIATVILILALIVIGVSLHYSKASKPWPPLRPDCPDYWQVDGSGNNTTCTNVKNLGTCPIPTGQEHLVMSFNSPAFSGKNGLCSKYTWANNCGVSWDGVTYGVSNPCQTSN
jgi:hypothetical protein